MVPMHTTGDAPQMDLLRLGRIEETQGLCSQPTRHDLSQERNNVNVIPDFHDGFFDGLWISDQTRIHLFLRTADKTPFTLVLHGVKVMNASNVKQGNIILDLVLLDANQITAAHIEELYGLSGVNRDEQVRQLLSSAKGEDLNALQVNSSYGAECTALFRRAELHSGHSCTERS